MPVETLFVIRDAFIFACSMTTFAIVVTHMVVQIVKARRRGESLHRVTARELRTSRVGIALVFGVIFLTRSQL